MIRQLPTFKGYTIDARLREFRKGNSQEGLKFIPFDSPAGDRLLEGFLKTINADTKEGRDIVINIWG